MEYVSIKNVQSEDREKGGLMLIIKSKTSQNQDKRKKTLAALVSVLLTTSTLYKLKFRI